MKPTITTNEYVSCLELVELHPGNTYWENRRDLARVNFDEAAGVDVDAFLLIMSALDGTPEAETAYEAHAAMIGDPDISREVDWPWTDEDMRDELMNRYPER